MGGLYLNPLQVISVEEIQNLDTEIRIPIDEDSGIAFRKEPKPSPGNPDAVPETSGEETGPKSLEVKTKEVEGLLKRYYSQFIEEKRIWEDRERGNIYNSRSDQNDVRLLLWKNTHRLTETYIVRDSPVLYDLHIRAAKLYAEQGKSAPALRHYLAAFKYHPLDLSEEMYMNGEWQKEDYKNLFLGPANTHRDTFQKMNDAYADWERAKNNQHTKLSELARKNRPLSEIRTVENNLVLETKAKEKVYLDAKKAYEESKKQTFDIYLDNKRKSDSIALYDMASVVKKLEDDNKERLKIINKLGTAGKGIYVLFDYKRNVDFFAYELLLERAHSQWPENPFVIFDIAEQYRQDSQKERAIDFYEKYLNLMKESKISGADADEKLRTTYLRLASLNADIKRKVIASQYYESYFKIAEDSKEKTRVSYEMGLFFANHIGDLKKASEFFIYWLNRNSKDWNPSLTESMGLEELEALAFFHLSRLDKLNRRPDAERGKLNLAYNQWKKIDSDLLDAEKLLLDLKSQKQKIKKDLLVTTEDEALSKYRLLDLKIEDAEGKVRILKTKSDKVPFLKIMYRLAVLAEGNRDFVRANEYYDKVIQYGGEVEIQAALKEKKRVERILATGNIYPPFNESI
ncbi:hypothetical protein LPTSP4_18160 [Leptospira ryugenii]|uniref:Tetratricopeptide repeat protein n=1 Tax=Leptospira ryugenii TaxID=1917863 RepID=A0A2P2E096_9LEPT|nr:hypothetical protein LPTSP4_18160 [Leptospira ryugenii]